MEMAFQGNTFALLGGDDGDDIENLLDRVSASAIKAEEPPSAVEKRPGNSKKPLASSRLSSSQFSSKPQRSFDHEGGRDKGHGSERHNRNGVERYNGQENGSRQNNHEGSSFRQNNGYWHDERPADGLKRYDGRGNGYRKKEKLADDSVWQGTGRPNGHKQNNTSGYQPRRGFVSSGYEVVDHLQPPRPGNVGGRERNYGWSRRFKGDNGSGSEVKVFTDKQLQERGEQEGVSGGIVKKLTEANVYKDDKEYRIRNWNSRGYGRVSPGAYRGYGHRGAGEGKEGGESRGYKGSRQGYQHANAAEGKDNGKTSESTEFLHNKEVQRKSGDTNAGSEGDNAIAAEASKESEFKKGKHDQILSKEEAERLAEEESEAKRMTLKEYEKKLQEKRKVLESMKMQKRRVTLDKDFESMHIIEKKNEETIFVKLNSDGGKLKKKVTMDKDYNNVHKSLVTNFKPAGTNYSGRHGGRYSEREENGNGGYSGHREGTGINPGYSRSFKRTAGTPPSFEDTKQFPALALVGSTKS